MITIGPRKGTYRSQESRNSGGVPALGINVPCEEDLVGVLKSLCSGVMVLGQSMDQWTVFGGRARRRGRVLRWVRKMGMLVVVSLLLLDLEKEGTGPH